MLAFAPATIPRLAEIRLDWRVVVFTLLVSVVTGVLFGLVPAVQLVSGSFTQALQESAGKGQVGVGGSRLRRYLVVIEVALAVVLLVGAGLALRSLLAVEATPAGFHAENAVTLRIALPASKYKEATVRRSFFAQLLSGVTSLPGIGNAGLVSSLPLSNDENLGSLLVKGQTAPGETVTAERRWASAGYFHALDVPFKVGRDR